MPVYGYKCDLCNVVFDMYYHSYESREIHPCCPKCQDINTYKIIYPPRLFFNLDFYYKNSYVENIIRMEMGDINVNNQKSLISTFSHKENTPTFKGLFDKIKNLV